jgi:hypothetical protein
VGDYEALDLTTLCNAGADLTGDSSPIGCQRFHGLPFQIGPAEATAEQACFVARGGRFGCEPVRVPVGKTARTVVVAHRLLESELYKGGPLGATVAEYIFHLAGQAPVSVPVRERFEILALPAPWGGLPFNAVADRQHRLPARDSGRWGDAGARQTEVMQGTPRAYVLWAWQNPQPDAVLEAIEIRPSGSTFLVAGITLGQVDEHPFVREGARDVVLMLPRPEDAAQPFSVEVEVDRGVATFPHPLPADGADAFLAAEPGGWGEPQNPSSSPIHVAVAATPSATLTVRQGDETLGSVCWGDLTARGEVESGPRLRVALVDRGRNWVRTTVVDDETGQPVPCRVHFRSPEGVPYQPHGHHTRVNSNQGTWHIDIGGDMRLGQITYAYIDGRCEGWLPRGEVLVDVARGFEYEPLRQRVTIEPGQQELVLRLKRLHNMSAAGWYSGDTHVHFLSTQGSHTEARGEDLNVVNLLLSQWGHLFTNTEEFTGGVSRSTDGRTIVYATQENRQHLLGHLTLLGLKEMVMPWCSDGPSEAELGGTLETTLSDWADRCHAQGGHVVIPHLPMPNGEPATLIATGRADAVEMINFGMFNHSDYYRYLNGGYRLPLVGGTDKMSSDVPVGLYRTYVRIPDDEEFTYENWCRNMARGRTFLSGGPLLRFSIEGREIGDTLTLPTSGGTVEVEAEVHSIFPVHRLEIVQQGRVVAATENVAGARHLRLRERLRVDGHTWLAARTGGPSYEQAVRHLDCWSRGIFAHTSPIYIACGGAWELFSQETAQYMLTLIDGSLTYIRQQSPHWQPGTVTHHHGEEDHLAYLERPFLEAREAIHRRMHQLGLPH